MAAVLTEICTLIVGGISTVGQGIATGLGSVVTTLFLTGTGTSADPYALSVFGGVIIIFAAVSLAFGLSRWVLNFVTSLGNRNR